MEEVTKISNELVIDYINLLMMTYNLTILFMGIIYIQNLIFIEFGRKVPIALLEQIIEY